MSFKMGRYDDVLRALKSAGAMQQSYRISESSERSHMLPAHEEVAKGSMMKIAEKKLLIPTTREMWDNFMVELVRSKICVSLSDEELKKTIHRARRSMHRKPLEPHSNEIDRDLPVCCTWDENQVVDWFCEQGLECVKEAFLLNRITGKRLVSIQADQLIKMGFRDLTQIREITGKIRELLGIRRPNIMRALMRIPPFETYLQRRNETGKSSQNLSFKKFCEDEGFPYDYLQYFGKNAEIPCTCPVTVYPEGRDAGGSDASGDETDSASTLSNVPTVECVARSVLIHNKVVQKLIEQILDCLLRSPSGQRIGKVVTMILEEGYNELKESDSRRHSKFRLDFAAEVARELIEEMQRAADVLKDIQETRKTVRENITPEQLSDMRMAASMFMEEVYPLAVMMSLGQFTLESIFKQQPEFVEFVDALSDEAEEIIEEVLPDAEEAVDEIVTEAEKRVLEMTLS